MPKSAKPIAARSMIVRRRTAETMPMLTPLKSQMTAAPAIRKSVRGARSRIRCSTDDWPANV